MPFTDGDGRDFLRNFVGYAVECDMDAQFRINIPQELRDYANLVKDITYVGMIGYFEIWDSAARRDGSVRYDMNADVNAEKMQKYLKPAKVLAAV